MRFPPYLVLVFRILASVVMATLCAVAAEPSLAAPAPFNFKVNAVDPGAMMEQELAARRALESGLPSIAAGLYTEVLAAPELSGEVRQRSIINLATALITLDRTTEATAVLNKHLGLPLAAIRLRQAMLDQRERRYEAARAGVLSIKVEELSVEDRGWWMHLQGLIADEARDYKQAAEWYEKAIEAAAAAGLNAQKTWFLIGRERARLAVNDVTENRLQVLRQAVERNTGRAIGQAAVSELALALNVLGRKSEAVGLLKTQMQLLSRDERQINDEWLWLTGLIAGADELEGRNALRSLLSVSTDTEKQRAALRLLAQNSLAGLRREEFRAFLATLIKAPTQHPILEDLLLFRALAAISDKTDQRFIEAEEDAKTLIAKFPGSPLKANALGLLTGIYWEQRRYLSAAAQASQTRAELSVGEPRAQLGVLMAEAYFRAKDFRTAADAYGSALSELPSGVNPGALMFQRVLAHINAGELSLAEKRINEYAADVRFDIVSRWQAEWNLARALQVAGEIPKAYARVNRLLAEASESTALPGDLRARLGWLQVRLAYDSGEYAKVQLLSAALTKSLNVDDAVMRDELLSSTLLLDAQAAIALGKAPTSLFQKLREGYARSDAAVYSYIIESDAAAAAGNFPEAQSILRRLADDFKGHTYAPYALYQAALYSERRAQDQHYLKANEILEELVREYPKSEFVFYARLRQGNLLRKLNDFGRARTLYEDMVQHYKYPQYQDAFAAELSLADCYMALASSDASRASLAAGIYERLLDQQAAPAALRIEAGFKRGQGLANKENFEAASKVWWALASQFLFDEGKFSRLGINGRWWLSRTLWHLGELHERLGKPREAREVYQLMVDRQLPNAEVAQERLQRGAARSAP